MQDLLGENGAQAINGMLQSADRPAQGIVATIVGVVTLLFAAIGVVVQLKDAFNTVWEVDPEKQGGIWGFVRTYIMSLAGVLAVGFLLLVSMLLTAGARRVRQIHRNICSRVDHSDRRVPGVFRRDRAAVCHDVQMAP